MASLRFISTCFAALLLLSGCFASRQRLSDRALSDLYLKHTAEFSSLIDSAKPGTGPASEHMLNTFFEDTADQSLMSSLGILSYAREFKGCRNIFVLSRTAEEGFAVYVDEKGILYMDSRACGETPMDSGSLDGIAEYELVEQRSVDEGWRYRKIADRWFIFRRQYFATFLH